MLRVYISNASNSLIIYHVIIWFLSILLIPSIAKTGVDLKINLSMIYGFSGYLVLGYLLGRMLITKKLVTLSCIALVISIIITAYGTFYLTNNDGVLNEFFYGYLSPSVIAMACSAFLLIKHIASLEPVRISNRLHKIIYQISIYSFGIYLIHPLISRVLFFLYSGFELSSEFSHLLYLIPIRWVLIFVISYLSVYVLRSIPIARRIVPL